MVLCGAYAYLVRRSAPFSLFVTCSLFFGGCAVVSISELLPVDDSSGKAKAKKSAIVAVGGIMMGAAGLMGFLFLRPMSILLRFVFMLSFVFFGGGSVLVLLREPKERK